ncbi:MAG: hypothetical protein CVU59_12870 [Deltaproteobacteria bacterium HGW-Deltaproteobacteria-17]|nr:MAG: hypothetical protein CVU59_12870 [Deltaproteobacteria bacterium HGW-Deltaproteobacteria-17]
MMMETDGGNLPSGSPWRRPHQGAGFHRLMIAFSLILLTSCDQGTTGQTLIEYEIAGAPLADGTFTDASGWEITLTRAWLTFGPLVFCSHQPTFLKSDSLTDCGQVMGEFGQAVTWDLLAGADAVLGRLTGFTGQVHSVQYDFGWNWPSGQAAPLWKGEAGAVSLVLEGRAEKAGITHTFEFALDARPRGAALYTVAGLPADGDQSTDTARVTLSVSSQKMLRYVDFDLLPEQAEPLTVTPGSALENQLRLGLTTGTPVSFVWSQKP